MSKSILLKLGLGTLIALSTLLAPATTHAASSQLCIFSYTNSHGATCTYAGTQGNCCVYTSDDGSNCPKICNPPA
ncbi:MAG: hypothetical protein ACJ76N_13625 [Thermoanaerobaculia bacterium]